MVIAGALFAFQIMQQNTSSGIAISKANEISEHIFENMERDLKQSGIFFDIDTTEEYNEETVNPLNNYNSTEPLIKDGLNWTLDICYDVNEEERVRILYKYTQDSEFDDGFLTKSSVSFKTETCTDTNTIGEHNPVASALIGFDISNVDSKFTLKLTFPGGQGKTYEYEKIISVPQL